MLGSIVLRVAVMDKDARGVRREVTEDIVRLLAKTCQPGVVPVEMDVMQVVAPMVVLEPKQEPVLVPQVVVEQNHLNPSTVTSLVMAGIIMTPECVINLVGVDNTLGTFDVKTVMGIW